MNKNARSLVAALRSGKYEQTTGCLRNSNAYCCLGVACDLYAASHKAVHWTKHSTRGSMYRIDLCEDDTSGIISVLPEEVREWLGFSGIQGSMYLGGKPRSLAEINDSGNDFDEIADLIETEPPMLFESEDYT